jgi:hypothetical protein
MTPAKGGNAGLSDDKLLALFNSWQMMLVMVFNYN